MPFQQFIEQVPEKEYTSAKVFIGEKIALFKPKNFLTGVEVVFEDFHFSFPTLTPPPIRIGKKEYQFKKGRLLVFQPGIESLVTTYAPCKEYYALSVEKGFMLDIIWEMTGKRELVVASLENVFSQQLMNSIYNFQFEIENFQSQCPLMLQSVSTQLVIQLLREICNNNYINKNKSVPDNSYLKRAIDYMEVYYNANITIEDICKVIHVSQYHFIRMFKEKTGLTPHEYLLNIRLRKAKELLKKGECSIGESAKQCGFINQGHFSSVFKQYIGVQPSTYRKKYFLIQKKQINKCDHFID